MYNVLILEDDPYISFDIKQIIDEMDDFCGFIASDMQTALQIAKIDPIHIILADIHIKGETNGMDTAYTLQNLYQSLVIFLTSYNDDATLQSASKVNSSGYILKPFRETELQTSIKLCAMKLSKDHHEYIISDNYRFDTLKQKLFYNNEVVLLTKKEQQLFVLLFQNRGQVIPFSHIDEVIWQNEIVTDTTRRQLFHRLKNKVPYLSFKSIRYDGYMMEL